MKKRKELRASIPADLIDKIFKAEGWTKVEGEVRVRRCKEIYTLSVDHKAGKYVATPIVR